jgi:hypothetical protein
LPLIDGKGLVPKLQNVRIPYGESAALECKVRWRFGGLLCSFSYLLAGAKVLR